MSVRKEKQVRIFGVFLSPLASWFAENYHKDYPTLEQTNTTYKGKQFQLFMAFRDIIWNQYCLAYLWAAMLFFHLLTSSPYLSQNCNISLFMIPQCSCTWFPSLWHINFMNELWILCLTILDMAVEIWNWENSLSAFAVKNR